MPKSILTSPAQIECPLPGPGDRATLLLHWLRGVDVGFRLPPLVAPPPGVRYGGSGAAAGAAPVALLGAPPAPALTPLDDGVPVAAIEFEPDDDSAIAGANSTGGYGDDGADDGSSTDPYATLRWVVGATAGWNGADLRRLVAEAALAPVRDAVPQLLAAAAAAAAPAPAASVAGRHSRSVRAATATAGGDGRTAPGSSTRRATPTGGGSSDGEDENHGGGYDDSGSASSADGGTPALVPPLLRPVSADDFASALAVVRPSHVYSDAVLNRMGPPPPPSQHYRQELQQHYHDDSGDGDQARLLADAAADEGVDSISSGGGGAVYPAVAHNADGGAPPSLTVSFAHHTGLGCDVLLLTDVATGQQRAYAPLPEEPAAVDEGAAALGDGTLCDDRVASAAPPLQGSPLAAAAVSGGCDWQPLLHYSSSARGPPAPPTCEAPADALVAPLPLAAASDLTVSPPAPRNLATALAVAGDGGAAVSDASAEDGGGSSGGGSDPTTVTASGSLSQLLALLGQLTAAARAGLLDEDDALSIMPVAAFYVNHAAAGGAGSTLSPPPAAVGGDQIGRGGGDDGSP